MRYNDFQAPADAVPLADALERFADPQLIKARRQARERLAAAQAAVAPQPNWFEGASLESVERWQHSPAKFAAEDARREQQRTEDAVVAYGFAQLQAGAWVAWGREGSPAEPCRLLPADAWRYFRFRGGDVVEARGPSPIRFYDVRVAPAKREEAVATAPKSARRRNAQDDALLKNRIEAVLATAKALWPDRSARPPITNMVKELGRLKKAEDYAPDTLRKILSGTYEPAKRLGINLAW